MEVAPINVTSQDEIGQVARAFDQVHSEAVRLAGEQALLRSSFNAMFVNLSRRSQTLIERLARMIDTLEQNEDDPDRLGSLFSMDHLVTRMRRNSENLLLLAGHENPRKWSDAGAAGRRGPRRDLGDRAVQPGHAEHAARHLAWSARRSPTSCTCSPS